MSEIALVFTQEKLRFQRHCPGVTFSAHTDNSRCHNGRMVTLEGLDALNTHRTHQI
jgi:hypothetical protein